MLPITIYVDLSTRRLVTAEGSEFRMPTLTLGDQATFALRFLDKPAGASKLVDAQPAVRTVRASIGRVLTPPAAGTCTLSLFDGPESQPISPHSSVDQVNAVLQVLGGAPALDEAATAQTGPGCWIFRFPDVIGEVPLAVHTNRLEPESFVRVRAFERDGGWWHELRMIQAPIAFTGASDRVLAAAPSVERIRAGAERVPGTSINTNEVQALSIPTGFEGTYTLVWDYRSSAILGTEADPDEIAAALNELFTDGLTRFVVTNPELGRAYIEFVGLLEAAPQDLISVSVHTFRPGDLNFSLDLRTAAAAAALRSAGEVILPLEIELEIVPLEADIDDPAVPGRMLTVATSVKLVRELIFEELATVPQIDWARPPQPRNYVPFNPGQILTGSQHYTAVLGDGVATAFVLDHNLGTEELHISVRENSSSGRMLRDSEYSVDFDGANSLEVSFPAAPAAAARVVIISTAGPVSAFIIHTHTIGQVTGLADALAALSARVEAIEAMLPTRLPSVTDSASESSQVTIAIPDRSELFFPVVLAPDLNIRRRATPLLPAVHDATATTPLPIPLPDLATAAGQVYTAGAEIILPGGGGRRGALVPTGGFVAGDGRYLYRVSRAASSNSYFPTDFERELFVVPINAEMLRVGTSALVTFELTLALLQATSRAQYQLVIEQGALPSQSSPSPTGTNLENVTWNVAAPILSQRLVLSEIPVTHKFGARVTRDILGVLTADRMAYGVFTGGATPPAAAEFALRARLINFDTENSVANARGLVSVQLKEGSAVIG